MQSNLRFLVAVVILGLASARILTLNTSPGEPIALQKYKGRYATLYKNEPTLCDSVKQYSGYFSISGSDKKYFYWLFESRNDPSSDPTVMWLTGGPGCSSMLALFAENGPCSVNSDGATTSNNTFSWNTRANLLYVDQPPGTGFSQGTYDHNEAGVADDMYAFLQALFSALPQYNKSFFVFGESYAGHYVPAISHRIYVGNRDSEGTHINLDGIGIGNGLTDPEIQYKYYADMAYNSTTAPSIISKPVYEAMKIAAPACTAAIHACQNSTLACSIAFLVCNLAEVMPVQTTGINPYDMRIKCEYGNLCYNFTQVEAYLNNADVQKAIGVNRKWESCNMVVNKLFQGDWMKNYQDQIPDLLDAGVRVLIYAGDVDFICNWLGNKAWTLDLDWKGHKAFNAAQDVEWNIQGTAAGKIRSAQNFTFLQVYQAGHMVPMDQPEAALQMLDQFLENTLA